MTNTLFKSPDAPLRLGAFSFAAFVSTPLQRIRMKTCRGLSLLVRIWPILSVEEIKGRPLQGCRKLTGESADMLPAVLLTVV